MGSSSSADTPVRRRQARAEATRLALLDAAVEEFAADGYEGASTRAIAARAGTHQPQINYHFESKDELWRAAVDHVFTKLDTAIDAHLDEGLAGTDVATREGFADLVRAIVRAVADLPQLNRIMMQEATADTARLAWIVERHTRARYDLLTNAWRQLRAAALVPPFEDTVVYYSLIGAASLPYVNAPEARRLLDPVPIGPDPAAQDTIDPNPLDPNPVDPNPIDPNPIDPNPIDPNPIDPNPIDEAFVDAHAEALVTMFLGPDPRTLP